MRLLRAASYYYSPALRSMSACRIMLLYYKMLIRKYIHPILQKGRVCPVPAVRRAVHAENAIADCCMAELIMVSCTEQANTVLFVLCHRPVVFDF